MEGKSGRRSGSRPESPASVGGGSVDLTQFGVTPQSPASSVRGRASPTHSTGGFSQTEGMSEELRFKLEIRGMKLEAEERRLKVEEARKPGGLRPRGRREASGREGEGNNVT